MRICEHASQKKEETWDLKPRTPSLMVDEKEEKHFHHAMGQKLHEVPFQATFTNLGSLRERKARPEERWRKKQRRVREWSSAFHRGEIGELTARTTW